jgi:predicted PurR-regulated permease PerM
VGTRVRWLGRYGHIAIRFSNIIAGVLMLNAEGGYKVSQSIATGLTRRGEELIVMSIQTIRSASKGVLGVAIIQTIFVAIGLVAMGVPAAGIWTGVVLILAIVQLPPIIIRGPIIVWVVSVAVPMLVILIGTIGGAITAGIIGLFGGPVVLAVGYQLLVAFVRGCCRRAYG